MTYTILATNKNLKDLIRKEVAEHGPNCSLNHIDVSQVTEMIGVFFDSQFNGDISKWNTSKVKTMNDMFLRSDFNGDISNWNTSNVTGMRYMFYYSRFNGDISQWDISSVIDMSQMFEVSTFRGDLRPWRLEQQQLLVAFGEILPSYLATRKMIEEAEKLHANFEHPRIRAKKAL